MTAANKGWYWLAAGVLALGLNGYYQDGGFPVLHRLSSCTRTRVAESRVQFREAATVAEVAMADHARVRCQRPAPSAAVAFSAGIPPQAQARLAQLQMRVGTLETARVKERVQRLQQVMTRREMQRAQVELQNGRIEVMTDRGRVQVAMPPLPQVEVNIPQGPLVEVTDSN